MSTESKTLRPDTSEAIRLARIPPTEQQDIVRLLASIAISLDLIAQSLDHGNYHVRTTDGDHP